MSQPARARTGKTIGSAQQCADRVRCEFDYGADAVIMHGATPEELAPIVTAYRAKFG